MATILIIDDEVNVLDALRMTLEAGGHDVVDAVDGDAGVAAFERMGAEQNVPDLVIVDLLMPKKDGYQTIIEIKERMPDARIIAISGGGDIDPGLMKDILAIIGADRILAKPFMPPDLRAVVERCLE